MRNKALEAIEVLAMATAIWALLSLLACYATKTVADDPPPRGLSTSAKIVEWYDADTATVDLSIRCRVRLIDCWAPEVRGKQKAEGLKSKQAMLEVCPVGSKVRLFIPATGRLQDSLTFGRVLGKIWVPGEDGKWVDVAEEMVRSGYATKEKVR
jgi:endonuclease YncB( thermonuclease family)